MSQSVENKNELINPLEYQFYPPELEDRRAVFESSYIGDQLYESPDQTVFLVNKQQGGRLLNKEEYLATQLVNCVEIWANRHLLPEDAADFFERSPGFSNIIEAYQANVTLGEAKPKIEGFIREYGDFCSKRLASITERLPEHKKLFIERVQAAVAVGDLPSSAADNLAMLGKLSFGVHDELPDPEDPDTLIGGYYDGLKQNISVNIFLKDEELAEVFFHEAVHAISGHTIETLFGGWTQKVQRVGLPEQKAAPGIWLNEAITEHIAQSLLHGSFDIITPEKRERAQIGNKQNAYRYERDILGGVVADMPEQLDIDKVVALYFTHRTPGNTEYEKALRDVVRRTGPEQSFSRFLRATNFMFDLWRSGHDLDDYFDKENEKD